MRVLDYMAAVALSMWPSRYRIRYATDSQLYPAAMLSGLAQYLGCVATLFVRYVHAIERALGDMGGAVIAQGRAEALAVPSVQYGMGFLALFQFVTHPLSLFLFYFALEGLVRFAAAAITREVLGTMPLYLLGRTYQRFERPA